MLAVDGKIISSLTLMLNIVRKRIIEPKLSNNLLILYFTDTRPAFTLLYYFQIWQKAYFNLFMKQIFPQITCRLPIFTELINAFVANKASY